LVAQKFVAEKQLWTLKREAARLLGLKNQYSGQIAKTQQRIGETRLQIVNFKEKHQQEVLTELRTTQEDIALAREELKRTEDILTRTLITAPKAGTVVDLKAHTLGGIIQSAKPILDIIPINDLLVIEAKISPTDIDMIHVGLPTKVQLVAYNIRNTPLVDGKLTHISADVFTDQNSGGTFYKARIAIAPEQLAKLKNITLYPGMPVQVMIVTESRSFADYLITPILSSLQRAFTEQ